MDTMGQDGQVIIEFVGYCDEGLDDVVCTRDANGYALDNSLCHAPVGSEDQKFYLNRWIERNWEIANNRTWITYETDKRIKKQYM